MPIPITLRTLRVAAGLTLQAAADQLEVTPSTVHRWEAGDFQPSAAKLSAIVRVYKVEAPDATALLENLAASAERSA